MIFPHVEKVMSSQFCKFVGFGFTGINFQYFNLLARAVRKTSGALLSRILRGVILLGAKFAFVNVPTFTSNTFALFSFRKTPALDATVSTNRFIGKFHL